MRTRNLPVPRGGGGPVVTPTLDLSPFVPTTGNFSFNRMMARGESYVANNAAYRAINTIVAMVTIEEDHDDELVITEHPVEFGAAITDHSYKRPSEVRVRIGWSQSGGVSRMGDFQVIDVKTKYEELLALQNSRNPFNVWTGKKFYNNMLVAGIRVHTDARFEYSFIADVTLKQILLVSTQTISGAQNAVGVASQPQNGTTVETGAKAVSPSTITADQVTNAGGIVGNTVTVTGRPAEGPVIVPIPPAPQRQRGTVYGHIHRL